MVGIAYIDTIFAFYGEIHFMCFYIYFYTNLYCLDGCFSMTDCSAQLSMFHAERRSRNKLILIII